jgi:hypothetical protein
MRWLKWSATCTFSVWEEGVWEEVVCSEEGPWEEVTGPGETRGARGET